MLEALRQDAFEHISEILHPPLALSLFVRHGHLTHTALTLSAGRAHSLASRTQAHPSAHTSPHPRHPPRQACSPPPCSSRPRS